MTRADDPDLQSLEQARCETLSCLFDVDSHLQALPPPVEKQPLQATSQSRPLSFPNSNPIPTDLTDNALRALHRLNSGQQVSRPLPPPHSFSPQAGVQGSVAESGQEPEYQVQRPLIRRRVTLYSLYRSAVHCAKTLPQEAFFYPSFFVIGFVSRLFAQNALTSSLLVGSSLVLIAFVGIFRPRLRDLFLSLCLFLGVVLGGFFR